MNLYIYSYNNYYNRKVLKAGDSINDYEKWLHYGPVTGVYGFTPGNGVDTVQIVGSNVQMYDGKGNYLIAHNPDTNMIDSRWFIIDVDRTRNGQWQLTLHRDLMVDYYDIIINSPMFIEKAIIPANNPLIYNKEGISVNQIKTKETQLKDETGCAWIVGYYDTSYTDPNDISAALIIETQDEQYYDISIPQPFNQWPHKDVVKTNLRDIYYNAKVYYQSSVGTNIIIVYATYNYQFSTNSNYISKIESTNPMDSSGIVLTMADYSRNTLPTAEEFSNSMFSGQFGSAINPGLSSLLTITDDDMAGYKDLILRFPKQEGETGYDYYKVTASSKEISLNNKSITNNDGSLFTSLWSSVANNIRGAKITQNNYTFTYSCTYTERNYTFTKIKEGVKKISIPRTANKPADAPYGIFCIPCPDEGKSFILKSEIEDYPFDDDSITIFEMERQSALNLAMEFTRKYSSGGVLYDLQLLPYCPFSIFYKRLKDPEATYVDLNDLLPNAYTFINDADGKAAGIILYPPYSSFTKNINHVIQVNNLKLENECDMYRLVSPNYDGQFEFNAAKNGGVSFFNVDCTYIPYTPYIHINPNFSKLYGADFNDARGLICGGDFSLPQMSDKWEQYKIQNKNYQAAFDREIQNMEVQHDVTRTQEKWAAATGALSGAASGALTGALIGGGYGAIAGGIIGAGASIAGGIADIQLNEKLRSEALDYKNDMFGYQLDNIKALPNSIMKTTAYTYNNKIYPIIEYYTCTEEEKRAVANKIAWNSMTIMAIGTMNEYIGGEWSYGDITSKGYIKGKLIRLSFVDENIEEPHIEGIHAEDYHIINAISGELNKGVYIT